MEKNTPWNLDLCQQAHDVWGLAYSYKVWHLRGMHNFLIFIKKQQSVAPLKFEKINFLVL